MISLPMVSRMSRGGMQVIIESLRKSGVPMAWFHCRGVGRSTTTPRSSSAFTRFSRQALPTSTVRSGRRPHMPRISESTGTFSEVAGSSGGMTELSHRPTITRFSGSQSFQELTIFAMTVSFLRQRFRRRLQGLRVACPPLCEDIVMGWETLFKGRSPFGVAVPLHKVIRMSELRN